MEKINAIKGGTEVQVNDKGDTIVCNFWKPGILCRFHRTDR